MPLAELREASFTYPDAARPALQEVSLVIDDGDVIGLAGPTGAGKTTLCLLLAGLAPHATGGDLTGSVMLGGRDSNTSSLGELIAPLDDGRALVAVTFQDPESQIIGMTVEEDLAFGAENLGVPRQEIDRRITEALAIVHLEHLRDAFPYALSGGQKQRVAIAAGLVMQPRLLILDEPTSELDPASRAEIFTLIKELTGAGRFSVLVVEHALDDLAIAVDRLILLQQGRIRLDGTPGQVLRQVDELLAVGVRPPDAALLGMAAEDAGLVGTRGEAYILDDDLVGALPA